MPSDLVKGAATDDAANGQDQPTSSPASSPQIRAITFDLDDTLWSCTPIIVSALSALREFLTSRYPSITQTYTLEAMRAVEKRVKGERPALVHDMTASKRAMLRECAIGAGYEHQCDQIADEAIEVFLAHRNAVEHHLFEGCTDLLHRCQALGLRIGTVTNGNADPERIPFLQPFVSVHVCAAHVNASKPSPLPFLRACELLECHPSQVLHVGDSIENDVVPARQVGMRTVYIPYPRDSGSGDGVKNGDGSGQQCAPDYVFGTLTSFCEGLQGIVQGA
ncbi:unnamed protein product [Vitrella brassicaformis CCMP3155]|uniref:Uncharacterized protein n=2 Tax=Vitrella brassicaformis TaxID=1169539 RepID=A0A0G4ENU6_VITBC|nr:unnamed protein product [Vitrella brassicaformis CCMP3155]|eukprot:CEL98853.1 unnamed protein product [Vitrella brassicaformis CCMP3155]